MGLGLRFWGSGFQGFRVNILAVPQRIVSCWGD